MTNRLTYIKFCTLLLSLTILMSCSKRTDERTRLIGKVYGRWNNKPLANVDISTDIAGKHYSTRSDAQGNYTLEYYGHNYYIPGSINSVFINGKADSTSENYDYFIGMLVMDINTRGDVNANLALHYAGRIEIVPQEPFSYDSILAQVEDAPTWSIINPNLLPHGENNPQINTAPGWKKLQFEYYRNGQPFALWDTTVMVRNQRPPSPDSMRYQYLSIPGI